MKETIRVPETTLLLSLSAALSAILLFGISPGDFKKPLPF